MPAEDRVRKPGAQPSAPKETGVSMRALLASCAAADAVSTPPSDAGADAGGQRRGRVPDKEHVEPEDGGASSAPGRPRARRGRDAA
ncbi:hypothetical protein [Streptomyces winkii]|uniref:hypothetical protein n=1 Tax=Streptomyces winkii TaxID=3051178 RepID=UPI0028D5B4BE|nr:hypothetical protein [Streptomyces sp. DSM 40971]